MPAAARWKTMWLASALPQGNKQRGNPMDPCASSMGAADFPPTHLLSGQNNMERLVTFTAQQLTIVSTAADMHDM